MVVSRWSSEQPVEDFLRDLGAEIRKAFEQPGDVAEVLLAFARPAFAIQCRPHLPPQDVVNGGDGQGDAKYRPRLGARNEGCVSRIGLHLHAQIGPGQADVQAVSESLDAEGRAQRVFQPREVLS